MRPFSWAITMSIYELGQDLSFCRIDGRPIFLDLKKDRYFRLSEPAEIAFLQHIESPGCFTDSTALLLDLGILEEKTASSSVSSSPLEAATQSAMELADSGACGPRLVAEVMADVYSTHFQLKAIGLKATTQRVFGDSWSSRDQPPPNKKSQLLSAAQSFLKARRFAPIQTRCLLDSLSMARFLKRRRLSSKVIIGVTGDPFTAHCWVQSGNLILNDTLGNTRGYCVIRVL